MSRFPCRCISCGRLHVEPVEWCPEPCHTDLRDSNNRVYRGADVPPYEGSLAQETPEWAKVPPAIH